MEGQKDEDFSDDGRVVSRKKGSPISMKKSISRYRTAIGVEGELQPGSRGRVLRNRLGITRKREMDQLEYEALLKAQQDYLQRIHVKTRFTAELLCRMHRDWLGEIYEWAGQYRTVDIEKNGFHWPPAYRVAENMKMFEEELLQICTPCLPGPLPEVSERIAKVHAELLLIHPFREGNGRLARWVSDLMAIQAGYPAPAYGFLGRGSKTQREQYLDAVKRGYVQDYARLTHFFFEAVRRSESEASR